MEPNDRPRSAEARGDTLVGSVQWHSRRTARCSLQHHDDETVRLWNPTTGQEVQKLEGHTSFVSAVAFSQDGSLLASASDDQTVRLWNPTTGQEVQKFENMGYITTLNITNDDKNLLFNRGTINIKKKSVFVSTPGFFSSQTLMIKNSWIRRR